MTVSEYLVDYLVSLGVTDTFGIPGGVVLDFLYAIEERSPQINVHLSYHEQGAAFSASGYAQISSKLGVTYATRGPGVANTYTAVADAYYDSTPLLVITAHSYNGNRTKRRIEVNQEQDLCDLFLPVTKYYSRIETVENAVVEIKKACSIALSGRKGPVVLDFNKTIFTQEINFNHGKKTIDENSLNIIDKSILEVIDNELIKSNRPIFLIGDGIHQSNTENEILELANRIQVPVLSSRYSQDIMPTSKLFFGYIGSHGLRYSNFILDKSDLIIVLGNLMSFPTDSLTFRRILENKKIVRFELDEAEYLRDIPGVDSYKVDLKEIFNLLKRINLKYLGKKDWLNICNKLKKTLKDYDIGEPIIDIAKLLKAIPNNYTIVNDVGNNEFFVCRAYAFAKASHRILFSKSYGAMGSSLPKSIGVYYRTRKPVISFNGDQGFQMNIQELQVLANKQLPIVVVILNNSSSGMIKSRQKKLFNSNFLHTTTNSGYSNPSFKAIANGYGIEFLNFSEIRDLNSFLKDINKPYIIEILVDEEFDLAPNISYGDSCQNMTPYLENDLFKNLDDL